MKLITLENLKNFWKDVKSYVDNGLSKKADSSHGTHVSYGTINGKAPGTPSAGTSSKVAREDHVHPVQTTVSGNAGSATKLATARTINGTSFDGSANITTANWGTARNITIGNTAKSVNGSANVSWSLSEIGAAPAGYGLGTTCQDKTKQDCNNILVTGFYMGSNMTNKPSGCTQGWIYLLVMRHSDSWVRQVAYDFGTASQVYTRVKQNGSWTAWVATDTNTWRGVQDNLTSTATDQSLSANQGKVLKGLIDGKAASNHTHNYAGSSSAGGNANAAVKLATARSINGTNFDGTGNITTSNWGTARNIQIGNTSKSVNGSGNVSWSLSEIGAASTAAATTSANGLMTSAMVSTLNTASSRASDWNTFKSSGGKINGNIAIPNGSAIAGPNGSAIGFTSGGETVVSSQGDRAGWLYFRPNGFTNTAGQAILKNDGVFELSNSLKVKDAEIGIQHPVEAVFKSFNHNKGLYINENNIGFYDWGKKNQLFWINEWDRAATINVDNLFFGGYNLSNNGYTKLPNGMILQWGEFNWVIRGGGVNNYGSVTLPISFPNNNTMCSASINYNKGEDSGAWIEYVNVNARSNGRTGLHFNAVNFHNTWSGDKTFTFRWFAIGY